jgi:zinc protease
VGAAAFCAVFGASGMPAQEPVVYTVEGVRVVHQVTTKNLVAAHVYLLGGVRQLTTRTAGVEALILLASLTGAEGANGGTAQGAAPTIGIRSFVRTDPDWSVVGLIGFAEEFDPSWAALAERLTRPSLDSASVEVARNRLLTSLQAERDDPDAAARSLAERLAFSGHAYAIDVDGTQESLQALRVEDLRAYHQEHFVRSRLLVSVVGPIDRPRIEAAIRSTLTSLPLGAYAWTLPDPWPKPAPNLLVEQRDLATDYIVGYFAGPTTTDEDYPAFQVALSYLAGSMFSQLRERGLSYAAGVSLVERGASGGSIYVSTTNARAAMAVINNWITRLGREVIPRPELREFAESSALAYYLSNQTSQNQADFLASSLLLRGEPQTVVDWVDALNGFSGNDVRRIVGRYVRNVQYGFLGDAGAVDRGLMLAH